MTELTIVVLLFVAVVAGGLLAEAAYHLTE